MRENKFRVYCEFEFDGELHKSMESPASWFLMTQTGKLWTNDSGQPPRPLGKEYKKAIPLFYTGLKDKRGEEIYQGDLIKNESGRICEVKWLRGYGRWDAFVRKIVKDDSQIGFNPEDWRRCVEIIGNKYMNPGLLKEAS